MSSCTDIKLVYRAKFRLSTKFAVVFLVTITVVVAAGKDGQSCGQWCANGHCVDEQCQCDPCWTGDKCDRFVDQHRPSFLTKHSKVYLSKELLTSQKSIFAVKAFDDDSSTCTVGKPCLCADNVYNLSTGGDLFAVNGSSGELFIKSPDKLQIDKEYALSVRALPRQQSLEKSETNFDEFQLKVFVQETLGRVKRQAPRKKNKAAESAFKSVESFATSFGLRTVAGEVNSLQVGNSIHYRLEIALPRATIDLFLEIYTKDSHTGNKSSPALSLYNFTIPHRVSGISFSAPEPQFFLSNKSRNVFDKLSIDFGSIKNTGPDRNVLTIYFSVVLTRKLGKSETKHTVMIGGEYGKGTLVWVAQSQITTAALSQSDDQVHFNVDFSVAPEKVALDSAVLFHMNANLEFRSDNLRVEVSKPAFEYEPDNLVSVGRVTVAKFAKNYQAIPTNSSHYLSERFKTVSLLSFSKSILDLGVITNIGEKSRSFTNNSDNLINFVFPIYALNFNENIGKTVSFTVRIIVGSKTVWNKSVNVSIVERKQERSTAKMLSSSGQFNAYNVSKGGLAQLVVKSDFAEADGFVDFALQVEVPFAQRAALFVPCAARFINEDSGFNVPYLNAMSVKPVEESNQFIFNFGRIHFVSLRSAPSSEENTVVAEITFRVPFHREIEEGTTLYANVKAFSGSKSNKVAIARNEMVVYAENKTNQFEVNTNRSVLWEDLVVDGGIAFNFDIDFAPNTAFREFQLTVQRDDHVTSLPELNICKMSLVKVGIDLPCTCVQADTINEKGAEYRSLGGVVNASFHNKANLNVGSISVLNAESEGYQRRLMANVALMIKDNVHEHSIYPVNVGVMVDQEMIWTKQINFTIATSSSLSDTIRNMAPKLHLKMFDHGYITPGFTTNVHISITIAPNTIGPLVVEVISEDDEVSVCGLWIDHIGDNMPCINKEEKANYDSVVFGQHNLARMHFDSITNFGSSFRRSAIDEERANTLEFVAMVRVSETAKINQTIKVALTHGHQNEKLDQELVIPVNGTDKLISEFEKPKMFTLKPADETNVTYAGIAKQIYFDIELVQNSQVPITILMDTSSDYKICSAAFVKIGKNYPCYSHTNSLKVSPGKFELGMICNTFLNKDSANDNLLRFAVALRPNGNVLPDRTFTVRSIAYIGPTPYSKNELLMSLASNYSADGQVTKGATVHAETDDNGRNAIKIRQRKWMPFNVRIPPLTTSQLSIQLQGDADESRAILVLHDLRIVSGGANIPCPLENGNFKLNSNSSVSTSQTNMISANLGYFSNFGFSHMLAKSANDSDKLQDDFLKLEVLAELTDHPAIVEDGSYKIAITTHYGPPTNPIVRQGQVKLTPVLEGDPGPKIDVNIKLKKKMEALDRGDTFTMTASLKHLPESTSEPINPVLRLFTANFVEVIRVDSASTNELPTLLNGTSGSTDILFPWILFSDEVVVNFTIQIDPNNIRGYGREETSLITPYRVMCEHFRTENSFKTPCSQLKHLNFLTKSSECNGPLGMESGDIADWRISASSAISLDYAPTNARPNSAKFWSPALRNGRTEYLQIDFGRKTRVVRLTYRSIRGLRRVASFHLLYSDDGLVWRTAANRSHIRFSGEDGEAAVKRPVEARLYRFVIDEIESSNKGKNQYVSVRLELHGCYLDEKASNETAADWSTHFSDDPTAVNRHMAVDPYTNVIYFCDATLDGHQMCYYSGSSGQSWNIIGRSIDSVEGFELATGKFFAVDYQRPAYFSSSNGLIWTPVDFELFNSTVSHSKFHRKITVPQLHRDDIRKLDIRMGNWRANYDGIYYDDSPIAKAYWKDCCGL